MRTVRNTIKMATTNAQIGPTYAYEKHLNDCSIKMFFAEKVILLTGATGFVGKALLEKLLRTCPAVTRIFVLIRPRTKQSIEERFNKLLENPVCNMFFFVVYFLSHIYSVQTSVSMWRTSFLPFRITANLCTFTFASEKNGYKSVEKLDLFFFLVDVSNGTCAKLMRYRFHFSCTILV